MFNLIYLFRKYTRKKPDMGSVEKLNALLASANARKGEQS